MKRFRGNRGRHSNLVPVQRGERNSNVSLEDSGDHDPDLAGWCCERFVKVEAKHVTDGEGFRMGIVNGVLLLTPNAVMFDPNVSDPLVTEHGPGAFSMITPLDSIARAVIYHSICAKGWGKDSSVHEKPEVYRSGRGSVATCQSGTAPRLPPTSSNEQPESTATAAAEQQSSSSPVDECRAEAHKQQLQQQVPTPTRTVQSSESADNTADNSREHVSEISHVVADDNKNCAIPSEGRTQYSHVVDYSSGLFAAAETNDEWIQDVDDVDMRHPLQLDLDSGDSSDFVVIPRLPMRSAANVKFNSKSGSKVTRHSSASATVAGSPSVATVTKMSGNVVASKSKQPITLKSAVTPEDMPHLFQDTRELLTRYEESTSDDHHLFLYLMLKRRSPQHTVTHPLRPPVDSHSTKKPRREHWFCVSRDKADLLYDLLCKWCPQACDASSEDNDDAADGRLDDAPTSPGIADWELLEKPDVIVRRVSERQLMPELLDTSSIITDVHVRQLNNHLPARAVGYSWKTLYSSDKHGFSMTTLYRLIDRYQGTALLLVKDTHGEIFGAFLTSPPRLSEGFYGNGESLLFTFYPQFKCYGWSQANSYFICCNKDGLTIGSGERGIGLWLDNNLYRGTSQACATFNNVPLTSTEDFLIGSVEIWGFV